ncbi:hypothetical protein CY0110_17732 [Crocosphaera chwakensis CCY0110]|uniref:Uncharacterized protein n=1 Tax=Crocosphaera chwakensis CCY0110 TaxID=391612 RepID=A3IIM8_9CHRO|nr:hypothetical protein CY0110_17732 [Crocosphaera chwakensis CCY0110]
MFDFHNHLCMRPFFRFSDLYQLHPLV